MAMESAATNNKTEDEKPYEADTAAVEDVPDINKLLLPEGVLPVTVRGFSLTYSNLALNAWIKQTSPVCAACSVAGAFNAVVGRGRHDEGAHSQASVLDVLRGIVEDQVTKAEESLRRLLLVPSVKPAVEIVEERLRMAGRGLGGKKSVGTSPKECVSMVRAVCIEKVLEQGDIEVDPNRLPTDVFESLIEVWGITKDKCAVEAVEEKEKREDLSTEDDDERLLAGSDEDDVELEATVNMTRKKGGKKKGAAKDGPAVSVSCLLNKWFRSMIALAKLNREVAPSTAGIGNWGIIQAVAALSESSDVNVTTRLLLGRGCGAQVKVKSTDDDATQAKQWAALCEAFDTPNTALIFHLTNHYALIFALRTRTLDDGTMQREILTAKKGQRPQYWMPFGDARNILVSWGGYKIMQISSNQ